MHNHRIVFSYLQNKEAVKELFTVVARKWLPPRRLYPHQAGARIGDNAEMAMIELVDFNESMVKPLLPPLNRLKKTVVQVVRKGR